MVIKIEDCSNIISQSNNPLTTTVPSFLELVKICDLIHEYKVDNLFIFCEEHVTSSFEIILKKTKELKTFYFQTFVFKTFTFFLLKIEIIFLL